MEQLRSDCRMNQAYQVCDRCKKPGPLLAIPDLARQRRQEVLVRSPGGFGRACVPEEVQGPT